MPRLMNRRPPFLLSLSALALLGLTIAAQGGASPRPERPAANVTVGKTVLPAALPLDVPGGKPGATLKDVAGAKATVLLFVGTECPISNKYGPDLRQTAAAYAGKGVRFVYVYANAGVKADEARRHGRAFFGASGVAVLDPRQSLADAVGATVTPEAVVLDRARTLRYRGRVDDRFVRRGTSKATGPTSRDLALALDAVLAGKPVKAATTAAVGCAIERAAPVVVAAAATGPTYARDVAPILQQNCQSCHRAGEIGPMPLETYEQAKKYAANIASVADARLMPPWKPVDGHGDFSGKRRLTEAQIATLKKWAGGGAPSGNLALTPPAPKFAKGWRLGQPDLVLTMPEKWRVAPNSPDTYRCFVLPTGLTEDKQVVAVEYRAGNKGVVHHVLGYIDTNGQGRARDEKEDGPGYTNFGGPGFAPFGEIGGWAPGNLPQFLPDGVGRLLPAGSDVVMQVHYHATGKAEDDVTQVGLYFAKKPVRQQLRVIPVAYPRLDIPPGEARHVVSRTYPVPLDANLLFVAPHMHLLGRTFEMTATLPDGTVKPLIKINDWDFQWQDTYAYREPLKLPRGSKVTLTATFDNSEGNPRNPNSPPRRVTWGEATTDEMCIGFLGFVAENENDPLIKLLDGVRRRRAANPNGAGKGAGAGSGAAATTRN